MLKNQSISLFNQADKANRRSDKSKNLSKLCNGLIVAIFLLGVNIYNNVSAQGLGDHAVGKTFTVDNIIYKVTTYDATASQYEVEVAGTSDKTLSSYPIGTTITHTSNTNDTKTFDITAIGADAFKDCTKLTSFTIPSSVKSIGNSAFQSCKMLTSITVPNTVEKVGTKIFMNCWYLKTVNLDLHGSITEIPSQTFYNCFSLHKLTVEEHVTSIGASAFELEANQKYVEYGATAAGAGAAAFLSTADPDGGLYDGIRNLDLSGDSELKTIGGSAFSNSGIVSFTADGTTLVIPNSVTSLGDYCFMGCKSVTSLTIGTGLTAVSRDAFSRMTSLTSVTFAETSNVKSLGNNAFRGCTALTEITIPKSVTSITFSGSIPTFNGCSALATVNIEDGSTTYSSEDGIIYNKEKASLQFCPPGRMAAVTSIPSTVTTINSNAFKGCAKLTSVNLKNGALKTISQNAFYDCSLLSGIEIPNTVTTLGQDAFRNAGNSAASFTVTFEETSQVTTINSFQNCKKLTTITLPSSVTTVDKYAFTSCTGLTSITLNEGLTTLGGLNKCTALTSVTIPTTTCKLLPSWNAGTTFTITIADGNTCINFHNDSGYDVVYEDEACTIVAVCLINEKKDITLPSSVTTIRANAFKGFPVTNINWSDLTNLKTIEEYAFQNCSTFTACIPFDQLTSLETIGESAFQNVKIVNASNQTVACDITFPASLTYIDNYAFA